MCPSLWRPIGKKHVAWHQMQGDGPSHLRTFKVSQPWWVSEWQPSTWWEKRSKLVEQNSLDADPWWKLKVRSVKVLPFLFGSQRKKSNQDGKMSFLPKLSTAPKAYLNRGQPSSKGLCTLRLTWVVWNNGVGKGVEPPLLRQRQIPRMELRWEAENMRTFKTFGNRLFG